MSEHTTPVAPKPPSVDRLSLLWRRINDHKMVQWSVAYVALAYGVQHGVTLTSEAFEWAHTVERISMLLLALGLPVVMTLAWYHGARASRRISGPELSIISILLVIGAFLFYVFARPTEQIAAGATPVVRQARAAAYPAPSTGISIAVLPFANVSGNAGQEFFSDGMTDEIMAALAKISALRVVGRESAFQFKGQKSDMHAVGQALGASYLIEGSVRKAGERVRITAQLVQADNGVSVWTDSYDRELKDIFATQQDIAQAIAASLRIPLGLSQGERLVSNRTEDLDSYQQYLHARALYRARLLTDALVVLEPVVDRDPNYAPAWAMLAMDYAQAPTYTPTVRTGTVEESREAVESALGKGEAAARKAIQLDSRSALAYAALGLIQYSRMHWAGAEDLIQQAIGFDPNDPDVLHAYRGFVANIGRIQEAHRIGEQLHTLEPFVPIYNEVNAYIMQFSGQSEASIPILEALPNDTVLSLGRNTYLAKAYAAAGRYREAADTILAIRGNLIDRDSVEAAARVIRNPSTATPDKLPRLNNPLNFVYAYSGARDRMFEYYERNLQVGIMLIPFAGWEPLFAPLRKTERFKTLMRKSGLVDYWKARGWPDLCHPVGADDFECT